MTEIVGLKKEFAKPPFRIFGLTFCKHIWKEYWVTLSEDVQCSAQRCARCLKDKK
jgi:hypothetical protein